MHTKFAKTKAIHHILPEFQKLLLEIEKHPLISRIIPGRISRQQKWSSALRFKISYNTTSGIKCNMCKGATAQELFIVCNQENTDKVIEHLKQILTRFSI
ncbi:MAG: hypothetical protein ACD_80C00232G0001 [uncultured bacterium (gcode 4)]|uniref:Metal-binding protein n=1 Tax=uncultured bacterium (gcode 4) TaxID=1234023 RepID=K1XGT4_9BACT|nr:MAG: hypothetical protein ACD_80C00232G0001 [uncultured bacterium (gcode 4)]